MLPCEARLATNAASEGALQEEKLLILGPSQMRFWNKREFFRKTAASLVVAERLALANANPANSQVPPARAKSFISK